MISKEEQIAIDSINEFEKNKDILYTKLYGNSNKCYTSKFSWKPFLKYLIIYTLFLLSYIVIFFIQSHSRRIYESRYQIKIRFLLDMFKDGTVYSFEIVALSIVLLIIAIILLLPIIYNLKSKKVFQNAGNLEIPRGLIKFWNYRLFYQQQIFYNRRAWITIVVICLSLVLIYINSDTTRFPIVNHYNGKEGHWTEYFPNLVKFGFPLYHNEVIEDLESIMVQESCYTTYLPDLRDMISRYGYYGFTEFYSIIKYWITAKIVTTNILMVFFHVELFILLPLFINKVDNKFKHLFILFTYITFSFMIINYVFTINRSECIELLKWYNIAVIIVWAIAQIPLFFISKPSLYFRLKRYFNTVSIYKVYKYIASAEKVLHSDEFKNIKEMFIKLKVCRKYDDSFKAINIFRLVPYILVYFPVTLFLINYNIVYRFSLQIPIYEAIFLLLLFNVTKYINLPSVKIKEISTLIADNYNVPVKILDYIMHYKMEYKYNRLGLLLQILFVIASNISFGFAENIIDSALFYILILMFIDTVIILPFILPFINSMLKHICSILILEAIIFAYPIFKFGTVRLEKWLTAIIVPLWFISILARNAIIINSACKIRNNSRFSLKKSRPEGRLD